MSHPIQADFVFFYYSIIYRTDVFNEIDIKKILDEMNPSDRQSILPPWILFAPSFNPLLDYYSHEMGTPTNLKRVMALRYETAPRENLVEKKITAYEMEQKWINNSDQKKVRQINIDVGFISLEQVVLATFKPYYHRVLIGQSVYLELELYYQQKSFIPFPWSYPDYQHLEKIAFFNSHRMELKQLIRS